MLLMGVVLVVLVLAAGAVAFALVMMRLLDD
jgi:hypothetical protein